MVAYFATEDAAEGKRAKYIAALQHTVAPVSAREHIFLLTDANAWRGKRANTCWTLMAKTSLTKTLNYWWVS